MEIDRPKNLLTLQSGVVLSMIGLSSREESQIKKAVRAVYKKWKPSFNYDEPWRKQDEDLKERVKQEATEAIHALSLHPPELSDKISRAPWYSEWALSQLHRERGRRTAKARDIASGVEVEGGAGGGAGAGADGGADGGGDVGAEGGAETGAGVVSREGREGKRPWEF